VQHLDGDPAPVAVRGRVHGGHPAEPEELVDVPLVLDHLPQASLDEVDDGLVYK